VVAGHRPLALALALAGAFAALPAAAQPSGAQAIHGGATLTQLGNTLLVTTTNGAGTQHSAINWQSFSVPGGTTTWFFQPSATSTAINRVVGPDPSQIYGTLGSNGRLVLVNPAGITVGPGAVVDTAGFTASTLRMSDADAIAGRLRFADGPVNALLKVDGQVVARGGDVVLLGRQVEVGPQAVVRSFDGAVIVGAGQQAQVTGRGLEGIVFTVQAPEDRAVNLGTLAGDAVGVFAGTLRHSGLVQAQAVTAEGGRVVLKATGTTLVDGEVRAQGARGAGGRVDLLGAQVGLLAGAAIDTSNTHGGGQIRVGGDYRGGNAAVPNAQATYVDADATLRADATERGNGGRVIVWADDTTRVHGTISARGGAQGGNGGFVETSGKLHLDIQGARVDASAPAGRGGEWLLDPTDITITAVAPSPAPVQLTGPNFSTGGNTSSYVLDSQINTALNGGTSVTIATGGAGAGTGSGQGDIVVEGGVRLGRTASGRSTLTLDAWRDIRFQGGGTTSIQDASMASAGGALSLVLKPAGNGTGSVIFDSGADVQIGGGGGTTAAVSVQRAGWVTNGGSLTLLSGGSFTTPNAFSNQGRMIVDGGAFEAGHLRQVSPTPDPTGSPLPTPAPTISVYGSGKLKVTNRYEVQGALYVQDSAELSLRQASGDLVVEDGVVINTSGQVSLSTAAGGVRIVPSSVMAGGLAINAVGGSIEAGSTYFQRHWNGTGALSLGATGQVLFSNIYSNGGNVTVRGATGVNGGTISATVGEGYAQNGGDVSVVSASGGITLDSVDSTGTYGGGNGGRITLDAGGNIQVGGIDASGGSGVSASDTAGGAGGRGGTITVNARGANASVTIWDAYVDGGSGGYSAVQGGAGGAGGSFTLTAAGRLNAPYLGVSATGGYGGDGTGNNAVAGAGGRGGSITVQASGASAVTGRFDAYGGDGGGAGVSDFNAVPVTYYSGVTVGAGGTGGSVVMRSNAGEMALSGSFDASGGVAGWNGVAGGQHAAAGSVLFTGAGSFALAPEEGEGTWYYLNVDGNFTNASTTRLLDGMTLDVYGTATNTGTLDLGTNGQVLVMRDGNVEGYGTLQNAAGGTLLGSGAVIGNLSNAGTIAPGTATTAGSIRVDGNLELLDTSVLRMKVADNAPPVPGFTHDQLVVAGDVTLGGALEVLPIPTVTGTPPPTTPPREVLLPQASLLAATVPQAGTGVTLIDTAGTASGSFTTLTSPSNLLSQVVINTVNGPILVPYGTWIDPNAVPVPPGVLTPGGTPLVDTIAQLLQGGAPVSLIQQALSEQDTVVTQFLSLLVKESQQQEAGRRRGPAIVQTGVACLPGS
jgi:filamentous hemagglutinin family protein